MMLDYTTNDVPEGYRCSKCGAHGVKLWRQYQTFADEIELLCASCACADQGVEDNIGADGGHPSDGSRTDSIKWLVPAVPTEDGDTFWGYTSTPTPGCMWWQRIPTRKETDDATR